MKKLIALLLCAIMVLSSLALVACKGEGGEKGTNNGDGTGSGEGEINMTDEVPKLDFGGKEFVIAVPWPDYWGANNYDMTELTNDTVYDEVYYRNRGIENRFNVAISTYEVGYTDEWVENVSPLILSNSGAFTMMAFAYSTASYGLISAGLLCPWNDIPYINYEKPWWNQSSVKAGTLNGTTFFNAGAFNWYSTAFTITFFFNDTVRKAYNIDSLYDTVANGEWTLDKLLEYSRLVAKEDGDGTWNEKDTYGLVGNSFDVFAWACGFESITNNGDGTYVINIGNDQHQAILEKLANIVKRENHLAFTRNADSAIFKEDRALFITEWLYNIDEYRMMESDFGIIPFPKYDENQEEYHSFSQAWGLANAIPVCTSESDYEFIGAIMEALSCESYNKVLPAYYEYTLKGRDTRDTESWEMLDLISNSIVYDFGYFFCDGTSLTATIMPFDKLLRYGRESTDLASYVATYQDQWETFYDEVMTFGK